MAESKDLFDIARQVTDEVLGEGTYAQLNRFNPDPGVQRALQRAGQQSRSNVDCPRAKSHMTPCVARDGSLATADDGKCVGCGHDPADLLAELVARYVERET